MAPRNIRKEYSGDGITVVWQPGKCIHSENCFHGLPAVFDPARKPWISMGGASSQAIRDQVKKCPSGALSLGDEPVAGMSMVRAEVKPNGPLVIFGKILVNVNGVEEEMGPRTAFCRCGGSGNKPYCDGTHKKISFEG